MDQNAALAVIQRFDRVIRTVAKNVADTFPSITEVDDAEQDASLLILSYAGLAPSQYGRGHVGSLETIERDANNDESRITALLSEQLRLDLSRVYGREADKREATYSMDAIPESNLPHAFDITDALSREANFRKHYPTLALRYVDDMPEEQMAEFAEVTTRTVRNRVAKEKRTYLERYARRGGLRVEGNESLADLQEACSHLKAAGR